MTPENPEDGKKGQQHSAASAESVAFLLLAGVGLGLGIGAGLFVAGLVGHSAVTRHNVKTYTYAIVVCVVVEVVGAVLLLRSTLWYNAIVVGVVLGCQALPAVIAATVVAVLACLTGVKRHRAQNLVTVAPQTAILSAVTPSMHTGPVPPTPSGVVTPLPGRRTGHGGGGSVFFPDVGHSGSDGVAAGHGGSGSGSGSGGVGSTPAGSRDSFDAVSGTARVLSAAAAREIRRREVHSWHAPAAVAMRRLVNVCATTALLLTIGASVVITLLFGINFSATQQTAWLLASLAAVLAHAFAAQPIAELLQAAVVLVVGVVRRTA